jgi:hypothetical protein
MAATVVIGIAVVPGRVAIATIVITITTIAIRSGCQAKP